ncbi:hypothetical protein DB30_07313 [Enhygromyxa salina]|uniref:Regulator of chromosome condensation (RCC1) repeat protein n=2 Tax=Enhygromyxa salina TaxID=215803 RepID=A0A0C2CS86_9BACT|nr:hypothetical protein DB30_07313 [Enhygromyxa salina]
MPPSIAALPGPAVDLVSGDYHNVAVFEDGTLRCWGRNNAGQCGYGHTNNISPWLGEPPPIDLY